MRTSERSSRLGREALVAAMSGIAGSALTAIVDRCLDARISARQKARERLVRSGSPHEVMGPRVARWLLGRRPSASQARAARLAAGVTYGAVWGILYALVRRSVPAASSAGGIPFAVPFFLACDGVIAPLLGLTPPATRIPWQLNAKELANHVAWTLAAEAVQRSTRRVGR